MAMGSTGQEDETIIICLHRASKIAAGDEEHQNPMAHRR
jgi:hypothetical protein